MNVKRKKIITVILCVLIVGASFTLGYFTRFWTTDKDIRTVEEILRVYKNHYYFESDDIVGAITDELFDKYSAYYTPEEYALIKKSAKGERVGIGISVETDTMKIFRIAGNSPCELAGVKSGGYIVAIDVGEGIKEIENYVDFNGYISGVSENSSLKLYVSYGGDRKEYVVTKREYEETFVHYVDDSGYYSFVEEGDKMKIKKLREGEAFNSDIGYISLSSFSGTKKGLYGCGGQFAAALDKFKEMEKTHLVLDLRGNGGGYMDILCDVASHLVGKGKVGEQLLICYSKDKKGKSEHYFTKSDYINYGFEKITVLADKGTASASEALIGAMLDYHSNYDLAELKVIVEGESTYGKGIMQTTYQTLVGAVKLTTAKIYFPLSDTCIHGVGINEETSPLVKSVEVGEGLKEFYAEK